MNLRPKKNSDVVTRLMWASDRTCNWCQTERRHLEIHHINGKPDDNRYDNLILLCRNCHSEVSARDLGRDSPPGLLVKYKQFWEGIVAERRRAMRSAASEANPKQSAHERAALRLANRFEKSMCARDAQSVLAMFTPPATSRERAWIENYILGGDLGKPFIRLFATRGFGYKVLAYNLERVRAANSKKVYIYVEEWLTWWGSNGWDAVPRRRRTVLTVVKFGSRWLVDAYREPADPHYRHKYGGLNG